MSAIAVAIGGKADMACCSAYAAYDPKRIPQSGYIEYCCVRANVSADGNGTVVNRRGTELHQRRFDTI
jgi:hypothetical protein